MAEFTLKKRTTGQMESDRINDVDDNWSTIETAIRGIQANASLLPIHGIVEGSIITYAEGLTSNGAYIVGVSGLATDLPSDYYKYTPGLILRRVATSRVIVLFNYQTGQIAVNALSTAGWSGWKVHG